MTEAEALVREIAPYAYNRAKRLEHVLERIDQSEALYPHFKEQGFSAAVNWIRDGQKFRQPIDPNLIRAL